MKKIIINADDYGLCIPVNEGIVSAYIAGAITDFSFMINAHTFQDSIDLLRKNNIKSCGLHLNLTSGISTSSGRKNQKLTRTVAGLLSSPNVFSMIKREIQTQIDLLVENEITITHLDSHQNIHLIPPVFSYIKKLLSDKKIFVPIRIPSEYSIYPGFTTGKNYFRIQMLNIMSAFLSLNYVKSIQVIGQDFFNNTNGDKMFPKILSMIYRSHNNFFEFPVHPGQCKNPACSACDDTYTRERTKELSFLESNKEYFSDNGIQKISFSEFAGL